MSTTPIRPARTAHAPLGDDPQREATIAAVAKEHLLLDTLESRHQDRLDFQEHSCMGIRDALRAAYEAGRQSARRRKR